MEKTRDTYNQGGHFIYFFVGEGGGHFQGQLVSFAILPKVVILMLSAAFFLPGGGGVGFYNLLIIV